MSDSLIQQAAALEFLLPTVMRRLFTLEQDHPATELPVSQLRVCTILQAGPRSLTALGEELRTSVSAITQLADRLERAGFVERVEGEDRRVKLLRLTPNGADLMRRRRQSRVSRAAQALENLSESERATLLGALDSLLIAASDSEPILPEDPICVRAQH